MSRRVTFLSGLVYAAGVQLEKLVLEESDLRILGVLQG